LRSKKNLNIAQRVQRERKFERRRRKGGRGNGRTDIRLGSVRMSSRRMNKGGRKSSRNRAGGGKFPRLGIKPSCGYKVKNRGEGVLWKVVKVENQGGHEEEGKGKNVDSGRGHTASSATFTMYTQKITAGANRRTDGKNSDTTGEGGGAYKGKRGGKF